ncbi:ArsR/SmtB family transcription factor [Propioniciclava sinopodophylli]|uniref:ArsR/SmtB family transcription factor n=1 Tax=Propioniciclava sinopodophylli TaxID=1837344 RepID=UPI003CD0D2CF
MTMHAGADGAPDSGDLQVAAALFHGLSDPSRLAILQHLTFGEHRVRDLTEHLGLAQSTVSAHLACLRECGLVASRPQGRASVFSLVSAPELLAVLAAAERLLATTGQGVALCPNYGVGTTANPAPEELKVHAAVGAGR